MEIIAWSIRHRGALRGPIYPTRHRDTETDKHNMSRNTYLRWMSFVMPRRKRDRNISLSSSSLLFAKQSRQMIFQKFTTLPKCASGDGGQGHVSPDSFKVLKIRQANEGMRGRDIGSSNRRVKQPFPMLGEE